MAIEIEKKFLLNYFSEDLMTRGISICQGYMMNKKGLVVRVRLSGDSSIDQPFETPDWIGKEVTHDPKFFNSNLIETPYSTW